MNASSPSSSTAMAATPDIEKIVCRRCSTVLDAGDNFCRHCGVSTGDRTASAPVPVEVVRERPGGPPRWSENRWVVLAMLFLVLGPLGLPMLWRSRQFSLVWKTILTIFVLGVTAAMVAVIWYVFWALLQPLTKLRELQAF